MRKINFFTHAILRTLSSQFCAPFLITFHYYLPGKIVRLLSPASWRLWACFNSLSDSSLATGMNKPI